MTHELQARVDEHAKALQNLMVDRGLTLSLAESCTGGLIASRLAKQAGASKYLLGAAVTYTGVLKTSMLGVKETSILCHGEVSLPVAVEMARGAKARMKSDWSVSVTGIAGPTGGTPEKPVGTVCFAVVGPGFEDVKMQQFKSESREEIQLESACFAIQFLWNSIHA
jgi:PncC family amidohydrolase